jgi:hypothetical protein
MKRCAAEPRPEQPAVRKRMHRPSGSDAPPTLMP